MNNKKYICPVCGYPELDEAPLIRREDNKNIYSYEKGAPTFVICPCCGTEFGFDDHDSAWEKLRKKWIENGAKWFDEIKKPKEWDFKEQLSNIEKINESE
ncbi:hypothetical protein GF336_04000 [Candidatus Woesearchaeota archaeon]|nr:hypothetical protein [Candidatus Woesearchaeota archaeon]